MKSFVFNTHKLKDWLYAVSGIIAMFFRLSVITKLSLFFEIYRSYWYVSHMYIQKQCTTSYARLLIWSIHADNKETLKKIYIIFCGAWFHFWYDIYLPSAVNMYVDS